jgi:hypothetical protein
MQTVRHCNLVLTYYLINMKNILLVIFLMTFYHLSFGQKKDINNYKFIIVPERFAFLKQNDQYQTSSLTKFLLEKNGFTTFLDSDEYPKILKENICNGLTAFVEDKSSMFKVKVIIELRDCFNKVVFTSQEGGSNLKDYKKGFQEAIRNAHASMSDFKYEAFSIAPKVEAKKQNIVEVPVIQQRVKTKKVVAEKAVATISLKTEEVVINKNLESINILYAQPKENGFQLMNLKPTVVFVILKTNVKDVFILKGKNGLFYKKERFWIAEFYEDGNFIEKKYQIKF